MSTLKKIGNYFGFGEEEYDDAYGSVRDEADYADLEETSAPAPVQSEPEPQPEPAQVTPIRASVRPVETAAQSTMSRIQTIHPRSYNDAKTIGTTFREGIPVIMNLSAMDEATSIRLVDFSAGLIFGLRGSIEKITNTVFLLTPENIEVTAESDNDDNSQASFFNQS